MNKPKPTLVILWEPLVLLALGVLLLISQPVNPVIQFITGTVAGLFLAAAAATFLVRLKRYL